MPPRHWPPPPALALRDLARTRRRPSARWAIDFEVTIIVGEGQRQKPAEAPSVEVALSWQSLFAGLARAAIATLIARPIDVFGLAASATCATSSATTQRHRGSHKDLSAQLDQPTAFALGNANGTPRTRYQLP
jgi:hypothetical protein